ncbi:hypothetical protein WS87_00695 (plasmid) [Burkholderia sp. MSMB0856]|nr:hypothetical protein WS87_00695 [Burkholderia sp. MSMB0856]
MGGVAATLDQLKIVTTGQTGDDIASFDSGTKFTATNVNLSSALDKGVHIFSGSSGTVSGGTIATFGTNGVGADVTGAGSSGSFSNLTITTQGSLASGVRADSGGALTASTLWINTSGNNAAGVRATGVGSSAAGTGLTVTTNGTNAPGAQVDNGAMLTMSNGALTTSGMGSYGLAASAGANAAMVSNVNIATSGSNAAGVFATDASSSITATGLSVATSGTGAAGAQVNDGAALSLANSALTVSAGNGLVVSATSVPTAVNTVTLSNVTLASPQGASIAVTGGVNNIAFNNSTATANNGQWLNVSSLNASNPTTLNLTVDPSTVQGAAVTDAASTSNVIFQTGTLWTLTGNSNLTSLTNNSAQIIFSAPSGMPGAVSTFKTLSVNNYAGSGGTIGLNSYLGGDGAPSDMLVVNGGTATGSTALRITNAGGPGASTPGNGIEVIGAVNGGTTTPAAFVLAGRVVAGPYEYQLFRGSVDASGSQDWYLRSERVDPTSPPQPPASTQPPSGSGLVASPPSAPLYRPEVASYLANQYAAVSMFVHTLDDRQGPSLWLDNADTGDQDGQRRSSWLRIVGSTMDTVSGDRNFTSDADTVLIQGGTDVTSMKLGGAHGRLHVGAMFGYGDGHSNDTASGNPAGSQGHTAGLNLGVYGTWYQNDVNRLGAYVDVWSSYGWFRNTVDGNRLPEVGYKSHVLTVSGETGYAVKIRPDSHWVVEPQVQLIYVHYGQDAVNEPNGTQVSNEGSPNGWMSRLGLRTSYSWQGEHGARCEPYLTLNWWHDSVDNALAFNQTVMQGLLPKNRVEVKAGLDADVSQRWKVWGNVAYQWGRQSFEGTTVRVGAKYIW